MSKVLIDVETKDLASIKDGDILVYNEDKKMFYKQTSQDFWRRHDEKLTRILKRYDEVVANSEAKIKELEELIALHEEREKEFETKIKNITNELIVMVENFMKSGGSM